MGKPLNVLWIYFERHDGQAVTTDDFVAVMEAAAQQDLSQFKLWYQQAGTPEITVQERYEEKTKTYYLTLKQFCPPTPEQPTKQPMVIPVAVGLLDKAGNNLLPQSEILVLKEKEQTFSFPNIQYPPILSVLREFSAPVKVHRDVTDEQLALLRMIAMILANGMGSEVNRINLEIGRSYQKTPVAKKLVRSTKRLRSILR